MFPSLQNGFSVCTYIVNKKSKVLIMYLMSERVCCENVNFIFIRFKSAQWQINVYLYKQLIFKHFNPDIVIVLQPCEWLYIIISSMII